MTEPGDAHHDLEAIRQLKARYFRTMDTKDWDAMRAVFTDDAVIDTSESGGSRIEGADAFMAFLRKTLDGAITVHHGHAPEITITSPTTATGIWALNDIVIFPGGLRLDGYGHYHETYGKVDGEWRITSSRLTRLHMDFTPPTAPPTTEGTPAADAVDARRVDVEPWHVLYEGERPPAVVAHMAELAQRPGYDIDPTCFVAVDARVVADRCRIGAYTAVAAGAVLRGDVTIGAHCTLNSDAKLIGRVTIGDGVRIAANTVIVGESHVHDDTETPIWLQGVSTTGIVIGDDVWIGANVTIVDGVTVGAHSIVGAGAVVTRNVEPYSVVGGVPARRIDDRRRRAAARRSGDALARIAERAVEQMPDVLARCIQPDGDRILVADTPGGDTVNPRPVNDAVELAAAVDVLGILPPRAVLIEQIRSLQDPTTGLFTDPRHGPPAVPLAADGPEWDMYGIESSGHALEILGAAPAHPIHVIDRLSGDELIARLDALDQGFFAWPSGAWIDAFGTGAWLNLVHHGTRDAGAPLWGWLLAHQDPGSGMWGRFLEPVGEYDFGWLMAVNGFYRASRGTYGLFGVDVPRPERVIDTVITHASRHGWFSEDERNACNVLDVIHPLWLCGRQTGHRCAEARDAAATVLNDIAGHWVDGAGFGWAPGDEPGLQGTEMWLSIAYTAAAILGEHEGLPFAPRGIHRLERETPWRTTPA